MILVLQDPRRHFSCSLRILLDTIIRLLIRLVIHCCSFCPTIKNGSRKSNWQHWGYWQTIYKCFRAHFDLDSAQRWLFFSEPPVHVQEGAQFVVVDAIEVCSKCTGCRSVPPGAVDLPCSPIGCHEFHPVSHHLVKHVACMCT